MGGTQLVASLPCVPVKDLHLYISTRLNLNPAAVIHGGIAFAAWMPHMV